jgi:hypothetical protein
MPSCCILLLSFLAMKNKVSLYSFLKILKVLYRDIVLHHASNYSNSFVMKNLKK